MDFLRQLVRGLVEVWRRLDYSGRATVVASGALAIVAVVGLSMWSARPEYRMLLTNLTAGDTDAVVADLEGRGVPYKLRDGGATVLVPSDQVYTLRTALSEARTAPSGQVVGYEIFDRPSLGVTEFVQNIQAQRARAGALARTIESYTAVRKAIVNLSMPRERLLEEALPSAAVVLDLTHPGALDQSKVRGILNIVASSVPRLTPDRVTVVDTDGNMLARLRDDEEGPFELTDRQLETIQARENHLRKNVEAVLEPLFANFSVAVNVKMNFDQTVTDTTTYDPDGAVPRAEQINTEETTTVETQLAGAPGAISGLPPGYQTAPGAPPVQTTTSKEETITNYDLSVTESHKVMAPGAIDKITVTALVDNTTTDEAGNKTFTALSDDEIAQYTQMVLAAAGADETRGDQVIFMAAPFAEAATVPAVPMAKPGMMQQRVWEVMQRHVLPIALMVAALVVIRSILRRGATMVTAPMPEPATEEVNDEVLARRRVSEEVERLSAQQPKVVAALLRTWLASEE